jgi:hypothetical protein
VTVFDQFLRLPGKIDFRCFQQLPERRSATGAARQIAALKSAVTAACLHVGICNIGRCCVLRAQ